MIQLLQSLCRLLIIHFLNIERSSRSGISENDSIKFRDQKKIVFFGEIIDDDLVMFFFEETEVEGKEASDDLLLPSDYPSLLKKGLELYYDVDTNKSKC
jgi:hypothetical protein